MKKKTTEGYKGMSRKEWNRFVNKAIKESGIMTTLDELGKAQRSLITTLKKLRTLRRRAERKK